MEKKINNRIFFKDNWGFFIGRFSDNSSHKHLAIQISIALNSNLSITDENNKRYNFDKTIIKSNVKHHLKCEKEHLLLLFNPISPIGHYLKEFFKSEIAEFDSPITQKIQQNGKHYTSGRLHFDDLVLELTKLLEVFYCQCQNNNHFDDQRIGTVIEYLEKNYNRVIPAVEIAEKCCLSESRFLHLFKEKTGITYRKIQQWNKISQSFGMLQNQKITETAHQFGFTDSAHYTKVFVETFGFSPKVLSKIER